jgi:hypothetical protein
MQKSSTTPTTQNAAPFFSTSFFSGGSSSRSRPGTSSGEPSNGPYQQQPLPNVLTKERKGSFSRKASFSSPSKSKRRANSSSSGTIVTDRNVPPALPDFALAAAAKLSRETDVLYSPASSDPVSRMLGRTAPTSASGYGTGLPPLPQSASLAQYQQSEAGVIHSQVHEIANKRIATLDYLRKA